QIGRAQRVRALGGGERGIESTQREIHLGERVPRFEGVRRGRGRTGEFLQRGVVFAEGVVGRRVFDEGLQFVARHAVTVVDAPTKRKDGLAGRPSSKWSGESRAQAFFTASML